MLKKSIVVVITFLLMVHGIVGVAIADGGGFAKRGGQIFYLLENAQYAVIGYKNGVQRMIVSVSFAWENAEHGVWIFPVPASHTTTQIDIIDGFPTVVGGTDIKKMAKNEIWNFFLASLFYAAIPFPYSLSALYVMSMGFAAGIGVETHKRVEKEGIVVELVSAKESGDLYNYLSNKGFNITREIAPQLENYISKNYSFVLSWLSDTKTTIREPGIVIEFTTDKIYFPLVLTSIYGSAEIPIRLIIMRHVTRELYSEIKPYSTITYWKHGMIMNQLSEDLIKFTQKLTDGWDGRFTTIELSAPATVFKHDLWMEDGAPLDIRYAELFTNEKISFLIPLILWIILSYITALICGLLQFGRKKDRIPFYLLLGSAGVLFAWVGVVFASFITRTKLEEDGKKWFLFPGLYMPLFLLLLCGSYGIIMLPLIS